MREDVIHKDSNKIIAYPMLNNIPLYDTDLKKTSNPVVLANTDTGQGPTSCPVARPRHGGAAWRSGSQQLLCPCALLTGPMSEHFHCLEFRVSLQWDLLVSKAQPTPLSGRVWAGLSRTPWPTLTTLDLVTL